MFKLPYQKIKKTWSNPFKVNYYDSLLGSFTNGLYVTSDKEFKPLINQFKKTLDGFYGQIMINTILLKEYKKRDDFSELILPFIVRTANCSARIHFLLLGGAYYEAHALLRSNFENLARFRYAIKKDKLEEFKHDITTENLKPKQHKLPNIKIICENTDLDYKVYEALCNYTHSALINFDDIFEIESRSEEHETFAFNLGNTISKPLTLNGIVSNNNLIYIMSITLEEYLNKKHPNRLTKEILAVRQIKEKDFLRLHDKTKEIQQIKLNLT